MKFYITTPIYYVNARPHIGHTYTSVAADVLARFYRMLDYDVFFLTGTDEHGQKIATAAEERNISPQSLVDEMSEVYKKLWEKLEITYDRFIRTTEPKHVEVVRKIFLKLLESGNLYKGEYSGYYCIHCESYVIPENETIPLCPDCKRPVKKFTEPTYFFKLSNYKEKLEKYYSENPDFIKPDFRKNEILNFVKKGLIDLSVTRKNVKWGIESPTPEKYSIYVWVDALLNYLSGVGYLYEPETFEKYWPPDVQLIGKDIMRFHHIIWPAILMALNLPLPKTIFAHGWWNINREKISKSKGNIVSPEDIIEDYGVEPLRFFLMREVPFGLDGEYTEEAFKKRYNSDLVNDLGNLVNRTLNLVEKRFNSEIPYGSPDEKLMDMLKAAFENYKEKMSKIAFSEAIEEIWNVLGYLNKFLDEKAPWSIEDDKEAGRVLYNVLEGIRVIALLLSPFIPTTAKRIWDMLGIGKDPYIEKFSAIEKRLVPGNKIGERVILFKRRK
ncbi:MAG: methionine--tRNA ligase [Candidatus Omnitrophota bacterium]|nr:MAG: methionine--tRNA ligase [Candidatus Omnitrophota bacterium]